MAKQKQSAFDLWFTSQHGKRPTDKTFGELTTEVDSCEINLEVARAEMAMAEMWEERQTAALHAWAIKDSEKDLAAMKKLLGKGKRK